MPPSYRSRHDEVEQGLHAQIAARRGKALVHVETFDGPDSSPELAWLCVVTDDRPGLLSLIASVILANSLDIVTVRAYGRERLNEPMEAIDFIAVRALGVGGKRVEVDPEAIRDSIAELLNGQTDVDQLARHSAKTNPPVAPSRVLSTRVYFASDDEDRLVVESEDRSGLLLAMTLAMLRERLTIESSTVTTTGKLVRDEFSLAEFDGRPLSPGRREAITRRLRELLSK